jgi:GTP-binding protein HflX
LETDRRLLRKRVRDLKRELDVIEGRKRREVASRITGFTVGLVGYTNAGKSTLLNKLTGATEFVADMPFATLDTRTRRWTLPDGRLALLSDTVGFLQRLPHHLGASFHATLEETLAADLLVHVVDASHPDATQQMAAVVKVLDDLSHHVPFQALALNKIDEVQDPIALHLLSDGFEGEVIFMSAKTGQGLDRLAEVVAQHLDTRSEFLILRLPASDGKSLAYLRGHGAVLEEEWIEESEQYQLRVRLDAAATATLARDGDSKLRVSRDEGETFEELVPKPPRSEWA